MRQIEQSNDITVYANFRQDGASIGGTAAWTEIRRQGGEEVGIGRNGGIKGTLDEQRFEAVITWSNGSIGVYSG